MKVALIAVMRASLPDEIKGSVDLALMVAAVGLMSHLLEFLPLRR